MILQNCTQNKYAVGAIAREDVLTGRRENMNCRGGSRTDCQIEPNIPRTSSPHTHAGKSAVRIRVPLIKPRFALRTTNTIKAAHV